MNDDIDLDARFIKLLTPKENSTFLEKDYDKKEYKTYLNDMNIFQYDNMPEYFYLQKLFHYCRLNEIKKNYSNEVLQQERKKFKNEKNRIKNDIRRKRKIN